MSHVIQYVHLIFRVEFVHLPRRHTEVVAKEKPREEDKRVCYLNLMFNIFHNINKVCCDIIVNDKYSIYY